MNEMCEMLTWGGSSASPGVEFEDGHVPGTTGDGMMPQGDGHGFRSTQEDDGLD